MGLRSAAPPLLALAAALGACSGASGSTSDGGAGIDGGVDAGLSPPGPTRFHPAPHVPLPQVRPHAGRVLSHVDLVTITFAGDPNEAHDRAFGDYVVGSSWLTAVGSEYGVGAGRHLAKASLPAPSTLADASANALIVSSIRSGVLPAPPATGSEMLYLVYVPSSVPFTDDGAGGGPLCSSYVGYHSESAYGTTPYAYAIIGDCGTGLDDVTGTASHELIEACTDPYYPPDDGYYLDTALPDPWYVASGSEVGDLCENESYVYEGGFAFQAVWSNAAAVKGLGPCIPMPTPDFYDVSAQPTRVPIVPAGGTVDFVLTGWSTAPDRWSVGLSDVMGVAYTTADLAPSLGATTLANGQQTVLTLHVPATASSGSLGAVYVSSGPSFRWWPVVIQVQ